ncbi:MAG: hypothetical protein NT069_15550 [Planctomycetota bacterium]|nr:hypothetical protein [Planctomycetota bacterium]
MFKRIWRNVANRLRRLDARWRLPVRGILLLALAGLVTGGYFVGRVVYVNVLLRQAGRLDLSIWNGSTWGESLIGHDQFIVIRSDPGADRLPEAVRRWLMRNEILLSPVIGTLVFTSPVDAETLRSVVRVGQPETVVLGGEWLTTAHFDAVSESQKLRELEVTLPTNSSGLRWNRLSRCEEFQFLSIATEWQILPPGLILELLPMGSLSRLQLTKSRLTTETVAAICQLAANRPLRIVLFLCECDADAYAAFRALPESASLEIRNPIAFDDNQLLALASVPQLTAFCEPGEHTITDQGMWGLWEHPRLEVLSARRQQDIADSDGETESIDRKCQVFISPTLSECHTSRTPYHSIAAGF